MRITSRRNMFDRWSVFQSLLERGKVRLGTKRPSLWFVNHPYRLQLVTVSKKEDNIPLCRKKKCFLYNTIPLFKEREKNTTFIREISRLHQHAPPLNHCVVLSIVTYVVERKKWSRVPFKDFFQIIFFCIVECFLFFVFCFFPFDSVKEGR